MTEKLEYDNNTNSKNKDKADKEELARLKVKLDLLKTQFDIQKTVSDSQIAWLKNMAVPDSGYAGEITVDDKTGKIEAAMLATHALNQAACCIVDRTEGICRGGVVLYSGSDVPDFQALLTYQIQINIIDEVLNEALSKIDEALKKTDSKLRIPALPFSPAGPAALIGPALEVTKSVLSYFRTDYSVKGIEVTTDDLLLLNILAGKFKINHVEVMLPTLYSSGRLPEKSSIVDEFQRQVEKKAELKQKVDDADRKLVNLATDKSNKIEDEFAELQGAFDNGKAVIELCDSFIEKLITQDDKAKFPLAVIIQQEAVQNALKNGASLMVAKISSIGGTNYTARNFWNSFLGIGKMPFFIRSGVVVNYNLFDGNTGQVLCAGAIPFSGGFHRVDDLPKELEAKRPPRR